MKSSIEHAELCGLIIALQSGKDIPEEARKWIQQRVKELEKK
jgi:hypothetical protein